MAGSIPAAPGRIFISSRREDTAYPAGWLYDRLADRYGGRQVFKDVDSIELGDNFVEVITSAVGSCDVLLALIGPQWLTIPDEHGRRRLDSPDDFVRLEIQAALTRKVLVIPILVDGAKMPRPEELPGSLAGLVHRQALELSPARFGVDTSRLLRVLDKTLGEVQSAGEPSEAAGMPLRLEPSAGRTGQRNRSRMLARVRGFWIDGVLEQSLHQIARVELGLETRPEAVPHPWELLVQSPDRAPQPLPSGVGTALLVRVDQHAGTAEFGITIGERRSQGLGTEATRLVLDWAFTVMGLQNILLVTFSWNLPAIRACTRAGFREIGRRRGAAVTLGQRYDQVLMDAIAEEFTDSVLARQAPRAPSFCRDVRFIGCCCRARRRWWCCSAASPSATPGSGSCWCSPTGSAWPPPSPASACSWPTCAAASTGACWSPPRRCWTGPAGCCRSAPPR
jgi:hypothetical protein